MSTGVRPRAASPHERDLARRLAAADATALQDLYTALAPMVLGFARRALDDADRAEDLLQQIFIEVWRRGASYDPALASPTTWVMMIARSRVIDERRRRVPEPVDPSALSEPAPAADPSFRDEHRVADLIALLPAAEARVLRLRFLDELSQTEISARTGLPLGTVKSRMLRGLERLREVLEAEEA